ncbi:MAG: MFS transporter [Pantoea sp.]|uniref:MFS transporter n=1 Tax=Pantoea sp. TaxID=69393 RepID=UPI0039E5D967
MNTLNETHKKKIVRKITLRVIPFVFILYIVSYLDRANIGYAALEMNKDLALSSEAFGVISGIFFLGYFLFEVPSNAMLNKFGARVWIARILITWGIIAGMSAFSQSATHLYILRFLLGVAEAGFFPGVIVYLTYWFRTKELATTVSLFTAAIPVSYIIGAPLSTWIMDHITWFNWSGWRWMLLLEGIPAVILGICCYFFLTDKPEQAKWLNDEEKSWLLQELNCDQQARHNVQHLSLLKTFKHPKVLYLAFIYFIYQCGSLGIGYWMPQIIKGFSTQLTHTEIGLIAMFPYILATVAMVIWSRHSDKRNERKMHAAIPLLFSSLAMLGAGLVHNPYLSIFMISVALAGLYSFKSPFWALPTLFLSRSTASISIAIINSIGNLGGFVGPVLIGVVNGTIHNSTSGLLFMSLLLMAGFMMTALIKLARKEQSAQREYHTSRM